METLVETCLKQIQGAEQPVSFDQLVHELSIQPADQKPVLETLTQHSSINFKEYTVAECPFHLFWRKDIQSFHAMQFFSQWTKHSAKVFAATSF
jgi:hypothetical protein